MDQQIGNAQFTIDEFASMMGLGRTVFYRKVRGVTGYSPNEYIRIIRMKKAAELLLENRYTVAEVSYKVGINDPFYFSKCFKQQFGVAPSVYLRGKEEAGAQETEKKDWWKMSLKVSERGYIKKEYSNLEYSFFM